MKGTHFELDRSSLFASFIGGGVLICAGVYWFYSIRNNENKKINRAISQLQSELSKSAKEIKVKTASSKRALNSHILHIFQLLFRISMQQLILKNNSTKNSTQQDKQGRRAYLTPSSIRKDCQFEKYLHIMIQQLAVNKQHSEVSMRRLMAKYGINKNLFGHVVNQASFKDFKQQLKKRALDNLEGIKKLKSQQLYEILNSQMVYLQQSGQDLITKIGYATIRWKERNKKQLLQMFSLIVLDITLLFIGERDIYNQDHIILVKKVKDIDQIDVQYAKRVYRQDGAVIRKVEELEALMNKYSQKLNETMQF